MGPFAKEVVGRSIDRKGDGTGKGRHGTGSLVGAGGRPKLCGYVDQLTRAFLPLPK
jgi:hypothetical protein